MEYEDYMKIDTKRYHTRLIIKNNEIMVEEIKKDYKSCDSIDIIGKGETARYISSGIGVKHAVLFTDKKFLFMNDFWGVYGLEKILKDVKYLFVPDHPHDGHSSNSKITYKDVLNYIKEFDFEGKIFIYKLQTSKSKLSLGPYKFHSRQTTDIPIQFFNKFIGIKTFNL